MRAVENGRYLACSASTGISDIVDPCGRVVSTFYTRHGDIFAYASVVLTLALLLVSWRRTQ